VAVVLIHCLDAAPIMNADVEALSDAAAAEEFSNNDLGESAEVGMEATEVEEVGEMADYAATKKKLEGELKKIEEDLKKKKAAAKKNFDDQMKKTSATFAKLYAPKKKGPSPLLDSPLGTDGQSGVSNMAQWAYAHTCETLSKLAHKKMEKIEKEMDENRYRHFSTAVCKEVLQSKVDAIGDLKFAAEEKRINGQLKEQKASLAKKMAYDRADMGNKVASYKVWERDQAWASDGGLTGQDADMTHMMTEGQNHKMGASRVGELVQAAHWAFARQKAHAIEFYERNRRELMKEKAKITEAHDLTLCRTGRKPPNPQLKYELQKAKGSLAKQLANMPAEAQEQAKEAEEKKSVEGAEKKVEEAKKEEKEEEKKAEEPKASEEDQGDLGESDSLEPEPMGAGALAVEFHKLIDASGGTQSLAERAKMYRDFKESEAMEQQSIVRENHGLVR
jgi:hypothetical protein